MEREEVDQWETPGEVPPLATDEVHIWRVNIDAPDDTVNRLRALLTTQELQRAHGFMKPVDRTRFIAARGALRHLLGRYGNTPSETIEFTSLSHGKPVCRELQPIEFNVSHSGMLALIAITRGQAVGVDIEQVRTGLEYLEIGKQVFTYAELRELAQIAPDRRADAFFDLWVRKEAYLKCTGEGLMGSPEKIHLGWPRRTAEMCSQAAGGMIHSFATAPGYASAFAVGKGWSRVRFLAWKLELE